MKAPRLVAYGDTSQIKFEDIPTPSPARHRYIEVRSCRARYHLANPEPLESLNLDGMTPA